MALTDKLVNIADAIRSKTNSTDEMTLDQMPGKIRGITTSGGGVTLPELENPATASDLASGKQLIDGNGNIVEGAVPVVRDDARYMAWDIWDSNSSEVDEPYVSEYPNCVQIRGVIFDEMLIRQHSGMYAYVPKNIFGDASPGDVRKGKIFTSEFGVKAAGTMEESGGGGAVSGEGWVSGVPYEFNVISDVYITSDGKEIAYGGWSATDYIPCHGVTALLHTYKPGVGTYYAFYGADYEVLPTSEKPPFSGITLGVPANAYYYRASNGDNLQGLAIVPIAI